MSDQLDHAFQAMQNAPDDGVLRAAYYQCFADMEIFLLLDTEPAGDDISPTMFDLDGQPCVLGFDSADRLADFTGEITPYAGLPGRVLAQSLADQNITLMLNPETDFANLLPPAVFSWLIEMLSHRPHQVTETPSQIMAPTGANDRLIQALDHTIARAEGLAEAAILVQAQYDVGKPRLLLCFVKAVIAAQPALAGAIGELAQIHDCPLDVAFFAPDDPIVPKIAACGLRFDVPNPPTPKPITAPGSDPDAPPILR